MKNTIKQMEKSDNLSDFLKAAVESYYPQMSPKGLSDGFSLTAKGKDGYFTIVTGICKAVSTSENVDVSKDLCARIENVLTSWCEDYFSKTELVEISDGVFANLDNIETITIDDKRLKVGFESGNVMFCNNFKSETEAKSFVKELNAR